MVQYVKLSNFRVHKDLHLELNGKNFFIIGDAESGKSSAIEAIDAALGKQDYAANALTTGQKDGSQEIGYELPDGLYKITRSWKDHKLSRIQVIGPDSGRMSHKEFLLRVFGNGVDPSKIFNHTKFFFEYTSQEKRQDYLMECILGTEYALISQEQDEAIINRRKEGSRRAILKATVAQTEITEDNYKDLQQKYEKEKKPMEPAKKYEVAMRKRPNVLALNEQLQILEKQQEQEEKDQELLLGINIELENLKLLITKLEAKKMVVESAIAKAKKDNTANKLKDSKKKVNEAQDLIKTIEKEALQTYNEEVAEINKFNKARSEFFNAQQFFIELQEANKNWNEYDKKIDQYSDQIIEKFKQNLPLPELTVLKDDDQEGKCKILWKGRELNYSNLSKGESIAFAMKIQRLQAPGGLNYIAISDASLLGKHLPTILAECHEQGLQTIVEFTTYDKGFEMILEEEAIPMLIPAAVKAVPGKRKK